MRSETARVLWIIISITVFLLAVSGTTFLALSAGSENEVQIAEIETPFENNWDRPRNESLSHYDPNNPDLSENLDTSSSENLDNIEENITSSATPSDTSSNTSEEDQTESLISSSLGETETSPTATENSSNNKEQMHITDENETPQKAYYSQPKRDEKKSYQPVKKATPTPVVRRQQPKYTYVKRFWIQVGSFSIHTWAENAQQDLNQKGYQAYITTGTSKENTNVYRLRIGPFDSKSEADYYLQKVSTLKDYAKSYVSNTTSKEKIQ